VPARRVALPNDARTDRVPRSRRPPGRTKEAVEANLREAIRMHLEGLREAGLTIRNVEFFKGRHRS
jgi:hypothetical protein